MAKTGRVKESFRRARTKVVDAFSVGVSTITTSISFALLIRNISGLCWSTLIILIFLPISIIATIYAFFSRSNSKQMRETRLIFAWASIILSGISLIVAYDQSSTLGLIVNSITALITGRYLLKEYGVM